MKAQLEDLSPMPFGKHKDTPMQDVPASYFHYLWTNGLSRVRPYDKAGNLYPNNEAQVADYIRRNLAALKKEHPDGIWS